MKLEALQGFLRVNPQNTENVVSLQGKAQRQRRRKKRKSALANARTAARQKVRQARQGAPMVRMRKSALQVPAAVAAARQKRAMNGGSIKNAIGGMEMSVEEILNGSLNDMALNAPGARKARRAD